MELLLHQSLEYYKSEVILHFFEVICTVFGYSFMETAQVNERILNELH